MKNIISILLGFMLVSCSSAELVNNWKNPDIDSFAPAKILIIGMTSNDEARQKFEEKLKQKYQSRGVEAVTSYELFEESLMSYRRSEDDLVMLEDSLIKDGFDSVLLTKVAGVEDRTAFFNKFDKDTNYGFKYDYYNNQEIYFNRNYYDEYKVYHVETSLYCICKTEERTLIWKGYIDIIDPNSINETVKDYINLVLFVLEEQNLIQKNE
ncbi:hypothetical protein JBL43_01460 [Aureibaculum sp. A20]|uniref:DUF4136 domain-containing protein n=1 Tax=Aureibaculum flavum TaxID=2795986 RepID=A0ABS0WLR6_9FLAO|nr:hypothetical protein [Aureibaculum flavum]MBJ2172884.1 hypothetical protein [Aureibaculum flavum]